MGCFDRALLIGNTRWHWAERDGALWRMEHCPPQLSRLAGGPVVWAAVGVVPAALNTAPHHRMALADVGLEKAPAWLGIDRALAAVAAWQSTQAMGLDGTRGVLVADAGTVLSLTLLDGSAQFIGGQLVPGLQLQLEAMDRGTVGLPSIQRPMAAESERFPSQTAAAMRRGSLSALAGAVRQAWEDSGALLWISGGDGPDLARELDLRGVPHRQDPDLVLKGLVSRI